MKILIVAQKADKNDDVLGFFHDWIKEFAEQFEKVTVICLFKGALVLPKNVEVFSLGKEQLSITNYSMPLGYELRIWRRARYIFRFYYLIWKCRKDYDLVFVHMIPLYAVLGVPLWRLLKKKNFLWYAHGHVSFMLRVAEKLVDWILTSTSEGCRLASSKLRVLGQGIDVEKFRIMNYSMPLGYEFRSEYFNVVAVGRIAPVKDYETLILAVDILVRKYKFRGLRVRIIGGALLDNHENYFRKLKKLVGEKKLEKYLEFVGSVPYTNIVQHISEADLMASSSRTGSLDKVLLEAMSLMLPVVSCNEAMAEIVPGKEKMLIYKKGDSENLARLIFDMINMPEVDRKKLGKELREIVARDHSLKGLISKIKKCAE